MSKHEIHIMLSSLIHHLVGTDLHFKASFIAGLTESLLCLALCYAVSIQWQ